MPDTYSATWVSHSSIGDFLKCPRAYYLNNLYRNPETGHKVSLVSPALALGAAVHEVIEALSVIPTEKRFQESLITKFDQVWKKYAGKKGGFFTSEQEQQYQQRGKEMLRRVMDHPGPLANKAVKIKMDLPHFWLSEAENIILCGKIDWLEYLPETDEVHIIDFKTGKNEEAPDSLQLPIYRLLVANCQQRHTAKASYWYLAHSDSLSEQGLPDLEESRERVLQIAKRVKLARKLEQFKCPQGNGCAACRPLEMVARGQAELVGVNDYNQDLFIIPAGGDQAPPESEIL